MVDGRQFAPASRRWSSLAVRQVVTRADRAVKADGGRGRYPGRLAGTARKSSLLMSFNVHVQRIAFQSMRRLNSRPTQSLLH